MPTNISIEKIKELIRALPSAPAPIPWVAPPIRNAAGPAATKE